MATGQARNKNRKYGRNRAKCERYRVRKGGKGNRVHMAKRSLPVGLDPARFRDVKDRYAELYVTGIIW